MALRAFLFDNVYFNPEAKGEEPKAHELVDALFHHLMAHPEDLPEDMRPAEPSAAPARGHRLRRGHDRPLRAPLLRALVPAEELDGVAAGHAPPCRRPLDRPGRDRRAPKPRRARA